MLKQTAIFVENDAVGCYDRLINNLILMVLKKLGLPASISKMLGNLWDSTVHLIKTIYGTLSVSYCSTVAQPLYGRGQGSICGPLFWLLCYWLIVESVDPSIPIATYVSACRSFLVKVTGVSFVDNKGLGMTSSYLWQSNLSEEKNRKQDFRHTLSHLQIIAQHWECLLFTTGGALNLHKCFWYSMSWKQTKGYPTLASIPQTPGNLTLTAGYEQTPKPIPRIEPTSAFHTLGVHISPFWKTA